MRRIALFILSIITCCFVGLSQAQAGEVISTVALNSGSQHMALSADGSKLYVTSNSSNSVSVVNTTTGQVIATWSVSGAPTALAISPDGTRLVVVTSGATYKFLDTSNGSVVQNIAAITFCTDPRALVYNPLGGAVYIACGSGNARVASINTSTFGTSIIYNGSLDRFYIAVSQNASELVAVGSTVRYINAGVNYTVSGTASGVAMSDDGVRSYVSETNGNVEIFGAGLTTQLVLGGQLSSIAVQSARGVGYVTDSSGKLLKIFSLTTGAVSATYPVGNGATDVAVNADATRAYVLNTTDNTVTFISLVGQVFGENIPTAAMQQFVRTSDGTCQVQPTDLVDFPALASLKDQAWGRSWAQWPNGGSGGFVCVRQPYYNSGNTWSVR
jgi:YVTN family beta-propeller protein